MAWSPLHINIYATAVKSVCPASADSVTVCTCVTKLKSHSHRAREKSQGNQCLGCVFLQSATQCIMKRDGSFWQPTPHLPGVVSLSLSCCLAPSMNYELWSPQAPCWPQMDWGAKPPAWVVLSQGICMGWRDAVVFVKRCVSSCPLPTMLTSG